MCIRDRDILRQAGYLETRQAGPARHNLPHPLTSFIGRGADLAQLIRRLDEVRLLTLTGAGGIGKTRLAIQLARQLLRKYADGVWLIDLAPISDPNLIAQVVATQLHLQEQRGRPLIDTVAAYLRDRRALLLLDNCERVLEASADLALAMLSRCSDLKILATSRQRLGIAGEQVWQVSPLSVPEGTTSLEDLASYEAIQLLLDRAALVHPNIGVSELTAPALVQICRRLDGIPLALELAAARMATLPPTEIAARLDDRFTLLAGDERGRPPRHQTLQAAVEWSHHLLDPFEQELFRRLSVFRGGFDLAAIESVCRTTTKEADAVPIRRLIDKSLVVSDAAEPNRFWMLETMREFARSHVLATSEDRWLNRRHAKHFLNVVRMHGGKLRARGATQHLTQLDRNIDNIRAALEWASANDHPLLARLALGLHSYWTSRCSFREALVWVGLALADPDSSLRQPLLASAGWFELAAGQVDLGAEHSQEALALAEASGDGWGEVRALANVAEALASQGDLPGAMECMQRAVAVAERLKAPNSGNFQDQALLSGPGACWHGSRWFLANRTPHVQACSREWNWLRELAITSWRRSDVVGTVK